MSPKKNTCIIIGSAPTIGDHAIGWGLVQLLQTFGGFSHYEFWTKHPAEYAALAEHFRLSYRVRRPLVNRAVRHGPKRLAVVAAWLRMWWVLRKARCVVYQGGPRWTHLTVKPERMDKLSAHAAFVALCRKSNVPVLHIGASIGPIGPEQARQPHWRTVGTILRGSTAVLSRDDFSSESAENLDLGAVFAGRGHDTALAIEGIGQASPPSVGESRKDVAICMRELGSGYALDPDRVEASIRDIVRTAQGAVSEDRRIVGLPMTFSGRAGNASDEHIMSRAFANSGISLDDFGSCRDPLSVSRRLANCAAAITMRMHVAILAARVGVPSIVVAYTDKSFAFMESVGLGSYVVDIRSMQPGIIETRYRDLMSNLVTVQSQLETRVEAMRGEQRRAVEGILAKI